MKQDVSNRSIYRFE